MAVHELGHVFGLSHKGPTEALNKSDDLRFSIMWYPFSFENTKIALTPGMADIKDMQIKYGLSDTQDGATNYVFTQSSIDLGHGNILANVQTNVNINRYVLTISDRQGSEGGIDTIDASALATNVYINLNDGEFSAIGTDWNEAPTTGNNYNSKGDLDGDTRYNVGIAVGAEIENAKGGSGNDYLKGNDLANTLEGSGGADTLEGGAGNDILKGGADNDTYKFDGTYGIDTIEDTGGSGSIKIDGQNLSDGDYKFESIYKNEDTDYQYIKVNGGADLLVLKENDPNRIIINDWSEANNLSINLTGSAPAAPQTTLSGDFTKKINDNGTHTLEIVEGNYVKDPSKPNQAGALDLITGTAGNDVIDGKDGSDALIGKAGDDYILGGIGGDYILGGLGKDTLMGGSGDDSLYGSHDTTLTLPTNPNHVPPTNPFTNKQALLTEGKLNIHQGFY